MTKTSQRETNSYEKKKLKKIDREILEKVLLVLYEYGSDKRTCIARKCNMGYDKCMLYVDFLEMFGFMKKERGNDGYDEINLTEQGINFCKTKLSRKTIQKIPIEFY